MTKYCITINSQSFRVLTSAVTNYSIADRLLEGVPFVVKVVGDKLKADVEKEQDREYFDTFNTKKMLEQAIKIATDGSGGECLKCGAWDATIEKLKV